MHKQRGLDILGLSPSATRTDARTAFRTLAKTWHPDRFAQDPVKAAIAEEKMKQVNEAFHFLLPLLPDSCAGQDIGKKPLSAGHCGGPGPTSCSKKGSQGIFSSLAASFKKRGHGKKKADIHKTGRPGQAQGPVAQCRTKFADRKKKTTFEAVFRNVVNPDQYSQGETKPGVQQKNRMPGTCSGYRNYFDSIPGPRRNIARKTDRSVGAVEKISPVAPISPVNR